VSPAITEPTNARSRRTRAALLAAARAILEHDGFEALTMTAVADRAGVTRRAAYMHFPSRTELVAALFDHVADTAGLAESLSAVWQAPDAAATLDAWAAHLARYHPRLLAIDRALQRVWHDDPDAAGHRDRVVAEKLAK
jgi:AcrR family transcriptional regulator